MAFKCSQGHWKGMICSYLSDVAFIFIHCQENIACAVLSIQLHVCNYFKLKKKKVSLWLFLSRLIMLLLPKTILHLLSLGAHSYPHCRGLCLEIDMLTVKARTICEEHNFCHSCWRLALNWVSHKRQNSNVITLFKIYKRYGMCKRTFQKPQLHHLDLGFFFFF